MRNVVEDLDHLLLRLANRETADGVTIKANIDQPLERFFALVFVHAALHDAKQG